MGQNLYRIKLPTGPKFYKETPTHSGGIRNSTYEDVFYNKHANTKEQKGK